MRTEDVGAMETSSDSITEDQIKEIVSCVKGQDPAQLETSIYKNTKRIVVWDQAGAPQPKSGPTESGLTMLMPTVSLDGQEKDKGKTGNKVVDMDTSVVQGAAAMDVVLTSTQQSEATHNSIGDSQFRMTQESIPSQIPSSQLPATSTGG